MRHIRVSTRKLLFFPVLNPNLRFTILNLLFLKYKNTIFLLWGDKMKTTNILFNILFTIMFSFLESTYLLSCFPVYILGLLLFYTEKDSFKSPILSPIMIFNTFLFMYSMNFHRFTSFIVPIILYIIHVNRFSNK